MTLLACRDLGKRYARGWFDAGPDKRALDGVTLAIAEGETVALVGESGSGKSTLARLLLGLDPPSEGQVLFRGRPLDRLDRRGWLLFRRDVQAVFQDSASAVEPRFDTGRIIAEPLRFLTDLDAKARRARVKELLFRVGLSASDAAKRPVEMSGGQLQRVCIARALAARPRLIVLDEATSNLDLAIQAEILDLLDGLRREDGVGYLVITHDLRLAARFASRVLVMDEGRIVEDAAVEARRLVLRSVAGRRLAAAVAPRAHRSPPAPMLQSVQRKTGDPQWSNA